MINKQKQKKTTKKDYCRAFHQKKSDLFKAKNAVRKKNWKRRRKCLEPKKYEVFKKKEAARVREYRFFKKRCQINYRSALQRRPQKQHQPRLQQFQENKFWAEVLTRLKDHSHPVCERRPSWLELLPKNPKIIWKNLRIALYYKSRRKQEKRRKKNGLRNF